MDNSGWNRPAFGVFHPLTAILVVMAGLTLALWRLGLDERPMHNDEAVNAVKFGQLWKGGGYKYDHNEHHGPSLYYATFALSRLTGAPEDFDRFTETRLRLTTVLVGVGLILLLLLVADGLGKNATVWAGLFTAISPAMVFYSRYYIHEVLLVCFTFLAIAAGWRYWRSRKVGWALLAGAGVGGMHATKETFVITLAAGGVALGLNELWNRWLDASAAPATRPRVKFSHLAAALGAWLAVALLLFSSLFTNAAGPLDSVRTYLPWLQRAAGASPHIHPWHFYLHRLFCFHVAKGPVWSEAIILALAFVGAWAAFVRRGLADGSANFVRFLALYTFALTTAYSLISYKTPWCLLNFWHGMILLAGIGAAWLVGKARRRILRILLTLLLLAGSGHLAWQAVLANGAYAADRRNPHVYSHTSPDLLKLVRQVEALAQVHPQGRQMLVKVMASDGDYWPLPWYLRNLKQVGWWDHLELEQYAPVMIVSAQLHAGLDEKQTHVMVRYFELRPQVFLELYVDLKLWRDYLASNPPKPD
ncbi:MAG TPA: TIGR03663 family protein [Candidatus Paceibacterota bacterium]|nr:TIGR03663 family protein [Verrucomicrobiota bacterium]HSA11845.1 TIGR03663 family protein [Candidatus Paceibacterota bacterium]